MGSLVSPSTVHHPALLAHQATTVDVLSGGRLVLGIGAGWQVNEHKAYGWELPPPKPRVDRFAEFIEILHGLLHDKRTTFAGKYFSVVDAPCEPKGANDPVPILVGTGSPRMLRLTARWAQAWNVWGSPTGEGPVRRARRGLHRRGSRSLHDAPYRAGALLPHRRRRRRGRRSGHTCPLIDRLSVGRPSWSTKLGEYEAAGIDELIVPDFAFGKTGEQARHLRPILERGRARFSLSGEDGLDGSVDVGLGRRQFDTEMRMSRRPCHVVPPIQHVPSRCTASITLSVRASSPKPTSTWLSTTSLTTSTPSAPPVRRRSGGPGGNSGRRARRRRPARARAAPPTSRSRVPGGTTRARSRDGLRTPSPAPTR